jgi:hypothetical protein
MKRPGNLGVMNKSSTLPRNMGKTINSNGVNIMPQKPKPAATPPAVRRQFAVSN